ncbi:MAG: Uma2 family endonuclease [Chloroflexaceae bacterium]|nr:Uma2 family endonuclease [Chloroflexaceae bacterium]
MTMTITEQLPRTLELELEESLPTVGGPQTRSEEEDDWFYRFRYGWRYVCHVSNGVEEWERVPLTEDDVLHPQEEDHVGQNDRHYRICHYLYTVLRARVERMAGGLVLHDMLVEWGVPGLKAHAPDVVVFAGVWERPQGGTFDLPQSGGRPLLAMEVTSPSTRHLDVASRQPDNTKTRFLHYAWAKIPLYIIVDEARRGSRQAPRILGYELTEEGYQPLPLDARGWLWVEPVGLWLGPVGERVAWFDEDGQEIWEYEQEQETRLEAEARLREEEEARQAAEAQARAEQEARRAAEERVRELERLLQQWQGSGQNGAKHE